MTEQQKLSKAVMTSTGATRKIHWRFTLIIVGLLAVLLVGGAFISRACASRKGVRSQVAVMLKSDRANVLAGGLCLTLSRPVRDEKPWTVKNGSLPHRSSLDVGIDGCRLAGVFPQSLPRFAAVVARHEAGST